ncbi:unnamed protein product, partial [Staurois parvus]
MPSDTNTLSVLIKNTDAVLVTLGRKGLTSGAMQSHTKQCAGADRGENCIVYIHSSTLLCMTLHSRAIQSSVLTVEST